MERSIRHIAADDEQGHMQSRWLTTFNDMITLLMVFFVLLFAMSSPDVKHFKNFQNALQSAMGVLHHGRHAPIGIISEDRNDPPIPVDPAETADGGDQLGQLHNAQELEAEYTKSGIRLTLDDNLLFSSGSARLTRHGKALLDKIVRIIGPLGRHIRVEGHTDNVPIATHRFPSNWELSTARAISVVKYLQNNGIAPFNLSAAGYGASKPRVSNGSEKNRSKNRRVEIILQRKAPSNKDFGY